MIYARRRARGQCGRAPSISFSGRLRVRWRTDLKEMARGKLHACVKGQEAGSADNEPDV
jgi:hypothetical protein